MECPECDNELVYDDYFGNWRGNRIEKKGEIYKCDNEDCEEYYFYISDNDNKLHNGYPC